MTQIFSIDQIQAACRNLNFMEPLEQGFVAYSNGEVVVPPVGELSFDLPPGDTHIKYGYIKNDNVFVIKIASGFYDNPKLNLPSNSGLMLMFSQKTGMLESILLDEGYLTDVRTAVAGQIAAKYLAPREITAIGVFGTGIQARMQAEYLKEVTSCRKLVAWGRSADSLGSYREEMTAKGFQVQTTSSAEEVAAECELIVTATPSRTPLLTADMIRPGTHITAMGADTPFKQELDATVLEKAEVVVADSLPQCLERGEIHQGIKAGSITSDKPVELGAVISGKAKGRTSQQQISIADLTGVAVQDIQITKAVAKSLTSR